MKLARERCRRGQFLPAAPCSFPPLSRHSFYLSSWNWRLLFFRWSKVVFIETYLERCEGRIQKKCVFKRKHRLLQIGNKQAKKHRDKQARYVFKGEHGLEEQVWTWGLFRSLKSGLGFPCLPLCIKSWLRTATSEKTQVDYRLRERKKFLPQPWRPLLLVRLGLP